MLGEMRRQTVQQTGRQNGNMPQQLRGTFHRHFAADHQPICPIAAEEQSNVEMNYCSRIELAVCLFNELNVHML